MKKAMVMSLDLCEEIHGAHGKDDLAENIIFSRFW